MVLTDVIKKHPRMLYALLGPRQLPVLVLRLALGPPSVPDAVTAAVMEHIQPRQSCPGPWKPPGAASSG